MRICFFFFRTACGEKILISCGNFDFFWDQGVDKKQWSIGQLTIFFFVERIYELRDLLFWESKVTVSRGEFLSSGKERQFSSVTAIVRIIIAGVWFLLSPALGAIFSFISAHFVNRVFTRLFLRFYKWAFFFILSQWIFVEKKQDLLFFLTVLNKDNLKVRGKRVLKIAQLKMFVFLVK